MTASKFRADINGLRAIAVIAVVLFHFKLQGFSGGFVGVDIFFVISGFLMTGIIVKGLENPAVRKFSIADFYTARARRIIPALFFLCLVLIVLGWFFLAPDDYVRLAREADRALLFLSNNYYYKKSGYFDTESHERLLLHTWSLSVEWQFYILYPLVLMALSKLGLRRLPYTLTALLLASFAWSVHKSYIDPNYAFYLLPSRAWEMLLGGLVFYISRTNLLEKYKHNLFYLGLILIGFSIFYYDSNVLWPGVAALVPTFGTALIIFAAQDSILLSNSVAYKLGTWSYSIYLWHWPLVVALTLMGFDEFTWLSAVFIFVSIILGWMSFAFVENPLRKFLTKKSNVITLLVILLALATVLLFAEKIRKSKGYMERIATEIYHILSAEHDKFHEMGKCHEKREKNNQDCVYGSYNIGAIVMGDSHAMSFMPLVVEAYKKLDLSVLDLSASGCPVLKGIKSTEGKQCDGFFENSLMQINKLPGLPVYLSNRYSAALLGGNEEGAKSKPNFYFDKVYSEFNDEYISKLYSSYIDSICILTKNNPVYMFRPVPELIKHVPKTMGRSMLYRDEKIRVSVTREYYENRNEIANKMIDELAGRCGVIPLEVAEYFCDDEHCYGDVDGQPVYFDDDHLNTKGALLLKDDILKHINTSAQ